MINIVQKKIERGDPLHQSPLDQVPFTRWNDARNQVEGKNSLGPLVVVIDREGDALGKKAGRGQIAFALKVRRPHFLEALKQPAVMRTRHAGRGKHLVEKIVDLVMSKKVRHRNIHFVSAQEPRNEKWIISERA